MDFRALLVQVQDRLSDADRRRLHFLFAGDIPKWYNIHPSMSGTLDLLQWLIEHDKVSEEDITILMKAFRKINCTEAVALLMGNDCSVHPCPDTFISRQSHIPPCATWSSKVTTMAGIFGKEGDSPLHLNMPTSLAIDLDGNLFVSDEKNNRIQRFAPGETSGVTVIWNLQSPQQIQLDYRTKALYVSEMEGGRVLKWDLQTREGVTIVRNCRLCTGVFVSSKGFIYVVENRRHNVVKYQWDGRIRLDSEYSQQELQGAHGLAFDQVGNMYVADTWNHRIQRYDIDLSQCNHTHT
ncbi:unnamed protein product [Rotaria sordida]|uniref:DED domain-containing protein n=1 Tax=Rotaria sordida TaxID=392033 RepID=A0A815BWL4_9BILA|nr:unnamed protein product [Rotaria sordida]CAF1328569.1 unnamed protein product [Rotaria sordida]CAF3794381.1 unnamed protein product [Rotaria sordida]